MLYTVALASGQLLILGMPFIVFVLVFLVVIIVGLIIWWYRFKEKKRTRHQKIVSDHILVAIKTAADHVIFRKCKLYKGEVRDFTPQGSRIKFQTDKYVNPNDDAKSSEKYFAVPGFGKDVWFPIGLEKVNQDGTVNPDPTQVQIKMWSFNENDPCPQWPNDPNRWMPGEARALTTAMAQEANDEVVMAVINKNFQSMLKDIDAFIGFLKKIPMVFILQIATLGGIALIGYIAYTILTKVSKFAG